MLPKICGLKHQNFDFISDNFASWSRISPDRNNTSSIEKRHCNYPLPNEGRPTWWNLVYKR